MENPWLFELREDVLWTCEKYLGQFELNSENRRLIRKTEKLQKSLSIQLKSDVSYIHDEEFIRRCIEFANVRYVDNGFLTFEKYYSIYNNPLITHIVTLKLEEYICGTVFVCYHGDIMHYWHAFYDLNFNQRHAIALGKYLMLSVIQLAFDQNCSYIYLGAAYDKSDYYKLNDWNNLQWWNGYKWSNDTRVIKKLCRQDYCVYNYNNF